VTGATAGAAHRATAPDPHPGPAAPGWEDPLHHEAPATSPILAVDGFEGPLDWLLAMARARKVDLARLSILALVEAFGTAMQAALHCTPRMPRRRTSCAGPLGR